MSKNGSKVPADIQRAIKDLELAIKERKRLDKLRIPVSDQVKINAEDKIEVENRTLLTHWSRGHIVDNGVNGHTTRCVRSALKKACKIKYVCVAFGEHMRSRLTSFEVDVKVLSRGSSQ